jgi:hypothetical protein
VGGAWLIAGPWWANKSKKPEVLHPKQASLKFRFSRTACGGSGCLLRLWGKLSMNVRLRLIAKAQIVGLLVCLTGLLSTAPARAATEAGLQSEAVGISQKASTVQKIRELRDQIVNRLEALQPDSSASIDQLARFERRMAKVGAQDQVEDCYTQIAGALNKYARNADASGVKLAQHLIVELACPSRVNQGNHNTCALAALQTVLYARDPACVCDLVFQAHEGRVQARDGRIIEVPKSNIYPDREALFFRPEGFYRSYASQLFQVAAANFYWQSQTKDLSGRDVPAGSINYVQDCCQARLSASDTRERLLINWSNGVTEIMSGSNGLPEIGAGFSLKAVSDTYGFLTGRQQAGFVLSHKKNHCASPIIAFASENGLAKQLQKLKERGALPAVISVSSTSKTIDTVPRLVQMNQTRTFSATPASAEGWHVVCLNDYDRVGGKVEVDNFWGPGSDHLGKAALDLHDLYLSACPAPEVRF